MLGSSNIGVSGPYDFGTKLGEPRWTISYLEMRPFLPSEVIGSPQSAENGNAPDLETLWTRGGFPRAFLAPSDEASLRWRRSFIRSYLERDIPQFGIRVPAETLDRFWTMLAHLQGGQWNAQRIAANLGLQWHTVSGYLDLMVDLMLLRRLQPWTGNLSKRFVKSPKIFVRDSGLLHALLGIVDTEGPVWSSYFRSELGRLCY